MNRRQYNNNLEDLYYLADTAETNENRAESETEELFVIDEFIN